jgi:endonuclease I
MKYLFFFFLFVPGLLIAQIPEGYYSDAEDKTGTELKDALYNIIKDHTEYYYTSSMTDTWDIIKESDRDTANSDNVILLYSGLSVDADQEYNSGNGWTREHVWAKSRGDFGTDPGPGTDCHHLRPENEDVNAVRSNYFFEEGGSEVYYDGVSTGCYLNEAASTFEPRDAVKGDVARMVFYMAVRYEGEGDEPDLELTEDIYTVYDKQPYMGVKSTLLKWNEEDPVDDFESNRNEVVYGYQGNRNPFIDHPEYASEIWESVTSVPTTTISNTCVVVFSEDNLKISSTTPIYQVAVYSITGRKIIALSYDDENPVLISGNDLSSGVYLVVVNETQTYKIIK